MLYKGKRSVKCIDSKMKLKNMYIFTPNLHFEQDATQSKFLNGVQPIWIQKRIVINIMILVPIEIGDIKTWSILYKAFGGARGVIVIVAGNGHGDTSSNPGRDWLHFTWERYESNYSPSSYG